MQRQQQDEGGTREPLLSVVVPVYRVEPYVEACIAAIRRQPVRDMEVIVVDDGTPDRSAELAAAAAAGDPRFRFVRRENGGLGAARNTGIELCRGRYLAFVDSDDVLPRDAWSPLIRSLEESGSDIAVGVLEMKFRYRSRIAPRMRENHRTNQIGVTLRERPQMLADVFAHNKVYRRSFWESAGLSFPEGVRYEDGACLARAFGLARGVDLLTHVSYHWRIRSDGSSITQGRCRLEDLSDRRTTKAMSLRVVEDFGDPDITAVLLGDVLPVDLVQYVRCVPGCSDEYWRTLVAMVRELWGAGSPVPIEDTLVPVEQRLLGWLVLHDRRADVERLLRLLDRRRGRRLRADGGRRVFDHPWRDEPGLPQSLVVASPGER